MNPLTIEFTISCDHIHLIFVINPVSLTRTISVPPNVFKVDGGVYGHRAIVLLKPYISTVDRGPPRRQTLNDAIYLHTREEGGGAGALSVRLYVRTRAAGSGKNPRTKHDNHARTLECRVMITNALTNHATTPAESIAVVQHRKQFRITPAHAATGHPLTALYTVTIIIRSGQRNIAKLIFPVVLGQKSNRYILSSTH